MLALMLQKRNNEINNVSESQKNGSLTLCLRAETKELENYGKLYYHLYYFRYYRVCL